MEAAPIHERRTAALPESQRARIPHAVFNSVCFCSTRVVDDTKDSCPPK